MDSDKLSSALSAVEAPSSNRDPHSRMEIQMALTSWSKSITQMLMGRFGKEKVIHILILAPVGRETQISWISDGDFKSCKAVFEILTARAKYLDESRITIQGEHFGG